MSSPNVPQSYRSYMRSPAGKEAYRRWKAEMPPANLAEGFGWLLLLLPAILMAVRTYSLMAGVK